MYIDNAYRRYSEVWNSTQRRLPEDFGVEFVCVAAWVMDDSGKMRLAKLNEVLCRRGGMWVTVDGEPVDADVAYWHPIPKLYDVEYQDWRGIGDAGK